MIPIECGIMEHVTCTYLITPQPFAYGAGHLDTTTFEQGFENMEFSTITLFL